MNHQTPRLLIIDNDEGERARLTELAESLGANVVSRWSGHEGLQHLASQKFNAVWVDQYLPDMYVGDFLYRALQVRRRHKGFILMTKGNEPPVKSGRSLGHFQSIDKEQTQRLLDTLSGPLLRRTVSSGV